MKRTAVHSGFIVIALVCTVLAGCSYNQPRGRLKGGYELVEGGVIFKFYDPDAEKVSIVGDFNNWMPDADPLVDENGDGEWTLFYPLKPGRYEYKFVVDGIHWIPDPRNPVVVSDGFEGENSVVVVPPR
jgi:1,4-alpha-glucan branching enzyme